MKFIKADRVPLVVTLFAVMMGVGGTVIGLTALFDPTTAIDFVDGADKMGIAWGGRNTGLGIASLAAVLIRNVHAYAVAFAGALFREISDLAAGLSDGGSFNSALAIVAVLLIIELVCLAVCLKGVIQERSAAAAA